MNNSKTSVTQINPNHQSKVVPVEKWLITHDSRAEQMAPKTEIINESIELWIKAHPTCFIIYCYNLITK